MEKLAVIHTYELRVVIIDMRIILCFESDLQNLILAFFLNLKKLFGGLASTFIKFYSYSLDAKFKKLRKIKKKKWAKLTKNFQVGTLW